MQTEDKVMVSHNGVFMPVDVWQRLHTMFEGSSQDNPEIYFVNMTGDETAACLIYLFRYSRQVQSRFLISGTSIAVDIASPETALRAIVSGTVTAALWMDFPGLPPIGLYVDEPDMMSLSFVRGMWSAQTVLALFDLMHQLITIAPSAEVVPDSYHFSFDEQSAFVQVWQEYQHVRA